MESINQFLNLSFWQISFLGNTLGDYAIAVVSFFVFIIVFRIFQNIIIKRLDKIAGRTETDIDDTFIKIVQSLKPPFYSFLAFWLALKFIFLTPIIQTAINIILIIWVVRQIVVAIEILIEYLIRRSLGAEKRGTETAITGINILTRLVLWSLGLLFILSNFGINITSLVAGLGIGGIAIALALQNILSDLFSSFAIYFDKPFVVGDFIIVGKDMGVVEKIGIKTTRIRALQGEEIVISNKELTSARVQNFKKMKERRVLFTFGVLYETPQKKLEKIPAMIEKIINSVQLIRFDRAHFINFGDSALNFEVVYYLDSNDFNKYMNVQQEINLKINKVFTKEKISMAYPTRTIYMNR
jgi:small-conductance mechanosensitive channel